MPTQQLKEVWAGCDADPLSFLVDDVPAFMKQQWEQGPAVFKATPARQQVFADLFSFASLQHLATICEEEGDLLEFGLDINAARYINGVRLTPNGEMADAGTIERLYRQEGCTMQFHQPQRFIEELWRLLAALERRLGCLVGCNAYLTPKGTQGLAPHYDDVEIFVVQTEGSKRWRLYRPAAHNAAATAAGALLARCHLANQVSGDLQQGDIGEPVMEVVLEVGDVLYMPRGTIHQAVAQTENSSHLTISTYQRWAAADLLQYTVSVALANPQLQPLLSLPLKAGLPLRWLSSASLSASDAKVLAAAAGGFAPDVPTTKSGVPAASSSSGGAADGGAALARQLAAACRSMAECLEDSRLGPRLLLTAGDAMADDFMRSRLPPHPAQLPAPSPPPTLASSVQCVGSSYFRLVAINGAEGGEGGCGDGSEDDEEACQDAEPGNTTKQSPCCQPDGSCKDKQQCQTRAACCTPPAWVRLISCLRNDRGTHMMSGDGNGVNDSDDESGSGGEGASGSELSSEDADERLPGFNKAAAATSAAAGSKRKLPEADIGVHGSSSGSSEGGSEDDDEDEDDDEEGEGGGPHEDLVFPAAFAPALVHLLGTAPDAEKASSSVGKPVPVRDILLPDPDLQLQVAGVLWDAGVLHTVEPQHKQQKQKPQKAGKQHQEGKQQQNGSRSNDKKVGKAPAAPAPADACKKGCCGSGGNAKKNKKA